MGTELKIETLLEAVVNQRASDLHLRVGVQPTLRIEGALSPVMGTSALTAESMQALLFNILDEGQRKLLSQDKEFDFSFNFGDLGRFRVNVFHERGDLAAALRFIPNEIKNITELGLPITIENLANLPSGLVLFTGPTSSGKSTSLAALIDKINSERGVNIITVEDPIEFTHKSKKSLIAQRELHYDTYSFGSALRSMLREDPDVILIGEMRDVDTIAAALTIAETGHLVFATLHTNSAAQSIGRMINVFPGDQQSQVRQQLASTLQAVITQRLVPSIAGPRVPAVEILLATTAVRNLIREGKTHQIDAIIQTSGKLGMQSMDETLADLVKSGTISSDEAKNFAVDQDELGRILGG